MLCTSSISIINVNDGAPGATGPQGVSVSKVVQEYRLSDSNTELTGSGTGYTWSETKPDIPSGKYLWTRERTDLSNNTSTYGAAHCDVVISGLVFDVDRNSNAITNKVWESDITNSINEYDGSTGAAIRDRVTKTETDISGINSTISSVQSTLSTKADGSTVTSLTTQVNSISDTVGSHTQEISATKSRIDNLKLGTNNYIKNSEFVNKLQEPYTSSTADLATSIAAKDGAPPYNTSNTKKIIVSFGQLTSGKEYVFSYDWNRPYSAQTLRTVIGDTNYDVTTTNDTEWHRQEIKFTANANTTEAALFIIASSSAFTVFFRHFQLEIGNIASDWHESPEDVETEISSVRTLAEQTADRFTWLVEDGTSSSNFTLTSRVAELISPEVVIKDPTGSATIITGGKIQANAITAGMLAANAIKSTNYNSGVSGSDIPTDNYSLTGTFLDLTTGNIYTPNFAVNSVNGEAYLNGTIFASAGQIGSPGDAYWSIGTVYDSTWGDYAGLIANGNALIQSGKLTLSSDRLNSQNAGKYIQSGGYWYDFGLQVPDFTAGTDSHDQNFLYVRRIGHQPTDGTLDTDWSYLFRVDKAGNIYWNGHDISTGTFLPLGGGEVTGATTFDSTLTVKGKLTASSNVETNLMLQTNLGSTSSAQLTGAANAIVKPGVTGTLGVGNGGTGKSSWTANRLVYSSASNALSELGAGTSGQVLKSNGSSVPSWVNQSTLSVGIATKATQDGDGNVITDTYRALDDNQFDTIDVTDAEVGDLIVKGAARFTNGLYGTASEASKVTNALTIQLNGGTTEGTNKFTYDGSAVKNINITRSSIGLGAAADKAVDTSIAASSSSTNLPTSAAVASFVEGKGYVTSSGVTSVRVQATSPVVSSQNTAQSSTLNTTISLADSYGDTKNPYGTKTANYVLAGPSSGNAAAPSFRKLVAADIPSITKAKISDFPTTWALSSVTGADDLKAIEGLSGTSGILKKTAANTWSLTTVVSGISIDDDVITVTKSDGTTQELSVNVTGQIVTKATVLSAADGTAVSQGSASKPVYFQNGVPVAGNTIPTITLNNSETTAASFYAPTGAGTSGQYLKSNGSGAPTWATFSKSTVGLGNVDNTADANKNVLTATKFATAQSVTLTGDTTGTASSQAGWSITTKTDRLSTVGDNRAVATKPNDYVNKIIFQGLKTNSSFGSPSTDQYSYVVGLRGWSDSSGGNSHELAFNNSGISRRSGATTSWGSWVKLIDSGNYTNYTVTKSGDGATGTWGIDISGNATNATYAKYIGFQDVNEIRFDINTKPSSARNLCVGYKWSDGTTDAKISRYIFYNGASQITEVQASTFYGALSGNATSATKATQDSDGNTINTTYLKLSGGTMTGIITTPNNGEAIHFPSSNANYGAGLIYGTNSHEALAIATKNAVTSFMVVHGSDPATWGGATWTTASPTLQTKNKSVYVNELIGVNVTPTYNFKVNGTSYLGGEVRVSHNNADTESVSLKYNETMKSLDFIFN